MRGMTTELTIGERIAFYRRRRGLSQEVVAGFVGRTADWLGKIENGRIQLDRLSVLRRLAEVLDVALGDLIAEPSLLEWTDRSGRATVPALRSVLMDYRKFTTTAPSVLDEVPDLDAIRASVERVWEAYQRSQFGYVTSQLGTLIPQARLAYEVEEGDRKRLASGRLALAYQVAATTLTKLGEADLAWNAADRGIEAAQSSENPVIIGALLRTVTHSLLATGAYEEALRVTQDAIGFFQPHLARASRLMLSVYGAQLLAGSMAAARAENRSVTSDLLHEADQAARRLGADDNLLWTAFGPTNVTIHRVSTAMELGDVQVALAIGPDLDTTSVPTERRVRHALEVSRALSTRHRDDAIATVLEAETLAPEQVRYHFISRHLVQTWLRTGRGKPSYQLTGLAKRLNVA